MKYECCFYFPKLNFEKILKNNYMHFTMIPNISCVKDGFWINNEKKFTFTALDQKFWIPASRILYIKKYEENYNEHEY